MKGVRVHLDMLKVFRDLAETKSFARTAERNYLTQPAVSQQLSALEKYFNTRLADRGKSRFTLTESGEILLESCAKISDEFRETARRIRKEPEEIAGTVRVHTVYSVGLYALSHYVRSFLRRYPKANLQIQFHQAERIYAHLEAGECDLGIVAEPWPHRHIKIIPFRKDRLALVCPPNHPFAKRDTVSLKELNGQNFIAFHRAGHTRWAIDQLLHRRGVAVNIVQEFDNIETIKRTVEIEIGISLLPENTVNQEVRSRTLARIPLIEGPFYRPTGIIYDERRSLSRTTRAFLRWLTRNQRLGIQNQHTEKRPHK